MKLNIGDKAPLFTLKNVKGVEVSLESLKGKKVLVSFHPLAFTPVCQNQVLAMEENFDLLKDHNTVALSISVDSTHAKNNWAKMIGVTFTHLLSDFNPLGDVAKKYDIWREKDGFSERANFLVDEEGKLIFAKVYDIHDLPDLEEIVALL